MEKSKQYGVPGPGQYDVGSSTNNFDPIRSRGMGFGTEKRAIGGLVKSTTEIPGPGQYTIDHASINGT